MSACGEAGPDVHVIIKELAIRRVKLRSEASGGGNEIANLWRKFSFCFTADIFIPYAASSVQTGNDA